MVGFIDMDCFYVAVERVRDPRLLGKACAVVQYPTGQRRPELRASDDRWRTSGPMGGIIAVSYEARQRGVTRQMLGLEAKKARELAVHGLLSGLGSVLGKEMSLKAAFGMRKRQKVRGVGQF